MITMYSFVLVVIHHAQTAVYLALLVAHRCIMLCKVTVIGSSPTSNTLPLGIYKVLSFFHVICRAHSGALSQMLETEVRYKESGCDTLARFE